MIPIKDENPTATFPAVTLFIILANIAIFISMLQMQPQSLERLVYVRGVVPRRILYHASIPAFTTIFSSMFLHGGFFHLLGNMWYLWIFGNNIEDVAGHFRFIFFYILCGAAGAIIHIISAPSSSIPTIGASGAIAGVLGAYLVTFPAARILTVIPIFFFFRIVRLPALLFLGFWIILQVLMGLSSRSDITGGVAWFAHIGGFVTGIILIRFFRRKGPVKTIRWG
jgi:membrane associated rhomboid family serine protease